MDPSGEGDVIPLAELFRHNTWANLRLLAACAGLSDAQLDTTVAGTYGTIRDTLMHLTLSERGYLGRITGQRPGPAIQKGEFPAFETLREVVRLAGGGLAQVATTARSRDSVHEEYQGQFYDIPVRIFLVQAINHATEHRTQIATILTQLGIAPPEMDGWAYGGF